MNRLTTDFAETAQARLERQKSWLKALLALIIILSAAQPVIWWWANRETMHLQASATWDRQSKEIQARTDEIETQYNAQQSLFDQLLRAAPGDKNILPLIEWLENIGRELGVAIKVQTIEEGENLTAKLEEKKKDKAKEEDGLPLFPLKVSIKAAGPAAALLRYLEKVENMQELTQVADFRIYALPAGTAAEETALNAFMLDLKLIFYLQRDEV